MQMKQLCSKPHPEEVDDGPVHEDAVADEGGREQGAGEEEQQEVGVAADAPQRPEEGRGVAGGLAGRRGPHGLGGRRRQRRLVLEHCKDPVSIQLGVRATRTWQWGEDGVL